MALRLLIENETNLADGGPVSFTVTGKRTVDLGRDQHLDWTLPDPSRFISGKHCEVRYKDGGYWLHDVSTNGTYLNGAEERMRGPHRLKSGDRFIVGQYIIVAMLGADNSQSAASSAPTAAAAPASYRELWADDGAIAPPIDPKQLRAPAEMPRPVHDAEFLDWAASVPRTEPARSSPSSVLASPQAAARPDDLWGGESAARSDPAPWTEPARPRDDAAPPHASAEEVAPAPFQQPEPAAELPPATTPTSEPALSPFLAPPSMAAALRAPAEVDRAATYRPQDDDFLRTFATAAGLPAEMFAGADQRELAQQLGMALRSSVEGVMQLLKARNQAKQLARSSSHTTIEATGNNPLKFSPTAEEALRIMFGSKSRSYLDAQATLAQTFDDLKSHQLKTYAALQNAVTRLVANLDPGVIARDLDQNKGGTSFLSSKKAKLWDDYCARWNDNMLPESGGPIAAFMLHFADYYDTQNDPRT